MRFHRLEVSIALCLCGTLGTACSQSAGAPPGIAGVPGGGTSASSVAQGAGPAARHAPRGHFGKTGVRRFSTPSCTISGTGSFVGGGSGNVAGGQDSGVLSGDLNDACDPFSAIGAGELNGIGGGNSYRAFIGGGYSNAVNTGSDGFVGAGYANTVSNTEGFIGAGNANTVSNTDGFIGAGKSNTVSNTNGFVGAGESNINSGYDSAVVGGVSNSISETGAQAFIGGGYSNSNSADNGVVAGGQNNNVSGIWAFIGGGESNVASAQSAAIGGGYKNTVSNLYAVIGGGSSNKVSGQYATVSGGANNVASGLRATVPGGVANTASGAASFAAGYFANAAQSGSFVWSDGSSTTKTTSTLANQFMVRASGGVKFFSNAAMTTGVSLPAGGGSWASLSDRAVKTNVAAIDDTSILDKVASMPISEWSYISERGVRHVGPMAQDFYAAFGVGEDNKHITSIDEDGVALAAIKALNQKLVERDATLNRKIQAKDASLHALQHQMTAMKAQMAALTAKVSLIH